MRRIRRILAACDLSARIEPAPAFVNVIDRRDLDEACEVLRQSGAIDAERHLRHGREDRRGGIESARKRMGGKELSAMAVFRTGVPFIELGPGGHRREGRPGGDGRPGAEHHRRGAVRHDRRGDVSPLPGTPPEGPQPLSAAGSGRRRGRNDP